MLFPSTPLAPAASTTRDLFPAPMAGAFLFRMTRRPVATLLVVVLLAIAGHEAEGADSSVPEFRLATAYRGHFDATIISAAWYRAAPRWTRADRLELSLGVIDDDVSRAFVFVGPTWRLGKGGSPAFAEFSFGPTALAGSTIGGRELGGNLHFRSALAVGMNLGATRKTEIALRISHVSNGGLRNRNPGLDSIGLSVVAGFNGP